MQSQNDSQLNPYSATGTIVFEEVAISIIANQFNATTLQLDFLKMSGIVPSDWELQKQPIITANLSQIIFQNGVNIVAQPRSITFNQAIDATKKNTFLIPDLARQFLDKLPNADYQGITINPKTLVAFPNVKDAARKFITEKLLSPGPWTNLGVAPMQANVNFLYQLDRCKLAININEIQVQQAEKQPIPALLFSGNFNYEVANNAPGERIQQLTMRLDNLSNDLESFRGIVNNKFLGYQQDNVFRGITSF